MMPGRLSRALLATALFVGAQTVVVGSFPHGTVMAAPPTFVQAKANEVTGGTTNNLAFTTPNTAGNLIVVYVAWNNSDTATVTDTRGNVYTRRGTRTKWNNNRPGARRCSTPRTSPAEPTRSGRPSAPRSARFGILYIHEYAGLDKVNPLDVRKRRQGRAVR